MDYETLKQRKNHGLRGPGTGLIAKIRELLKIRPMTCAEVCTKLELRGRKNAQRILTSMQQAVGRIGGIEVVDPEAKEIVYQLVPAPKIKPKVASKGSGIVALPCRELVIDRPLSGPDPRMEHWKLAMETRR